MTVLDLGNNVAVTTQIPAQTLAASASDATAVDLSGVRSLRLMRRSSSRRFRVLPMLVPIS